MTGASVVVAGAGTSGLSAARYLVGQGADVVVADDRTDLGGWAVPVPVVAGMTEPPPGTDLIVTSPGWRPDTPLFLAAAVAGIPVIGDVELAWWAELAPDPALPVDLRTAPGDLREPARPARRPWLAVTGTNGKTTTIGMVEAILQAAGRHAVASGNIGLGVLDVVTAEPRHDVIAVELSSFQLHYAPTVRPSAGVVLNVAEDHLDWHGSMAAYAADKARALTGDVAVAVVDDANAAALLAAAPAGTRVGVTAGEPAAGQLGVRDGVLVDEAFGAGALLPAVEIRPVGAHNVTNALAAAAVTLAIGVSGAQVAAGLRAYQPGGHRNALVAEVEGVRYVDDSKATNPHAAFASLMAYGSVVWVAGGQLKGAAVDDLVAAVAGRLRGVVVIGVDRELIAAALRRHAPDVPRMVIAATDDGVMTTVVTAAARMAAPGDVVLLAPAAASLDMFSSYAARGNAFADAVAALPGTDRA
ncbi:UDP-N-acetylmuramoyl-L-alanine--D-glutamate ligase [Nakamurella deserti]|uniref:UDP-N-acetylmuramoyl-L-alanine--D-glutamate ligase n=1 Tax=Nakamurella deserti TaxID=2164074 RepID=UPI000DBE1F2A